MDAAMSCDVVLVVGTSATVAPASMIPTVAKQNGAVVCEFNLEPALGPLADYRVLGPCGTTLPSLIELI